jgi:hypothetical protein
MTQPPTLPSTGPVRASQPLRAGCAERLTASLESRPSSPAGWLRKAFRGAGDPSSVPMINPVSNLRFNLSSLGGGDSPVS